MNTQFKDTKHKFFALYYGIFAVVGIALLSLQAFQATLSLLIIPLYLIIYAQLIFMLVGAIYYWKLNRKGLKILFWISLSLIPMFMTPLIIYMPRVTTGLFIYCQTNNIVSGLVFDFHIFFNSALKILDNHVWGFGVNIIEFFIFLRFKYIAEKQKISMSLLKH